MQHPFFVRTVVQINTARYRNMLKFRFIGQFAIEYVGAIINRPVILQSKITITDSSVAPLPLNDM